MSPVIDVQRRMMQLGRVRLGQKGAKGEPKKLDTFRFTSASRDLLYAVAERYGGKAREWKGAPDEGYFEVVSEARELDIVLPPVYSAADGTPTTSYSQWYELWSGGGCQRRCDGQTEALTGEPCMCNPDDRQCEITTRMSFMLPDIPGLGVWRLDSKGWNAAVELPGTLEVLMMAAARNTFVPAVLRIENRTKKEPGRGTRRFVVPVLDLPGVRIGELLAAAGSPVALNAPAPRPPRPELPAGPAAPTDEAAAFVHDEAPPIGEAPPLPLNSSATPQEGGAGFQPQNAEDAGASGPAPPDEWADEAQVTAVLELAARVGKEAHEKAVAAIAKHRAKYEGRVSAAWLARLSDALLAQAPAEDPEPESLFKAPSGARGR